MSEHWLVLNLEWNSEVVSLSEHETEWNSEPPLLSEQMRWSRILSELLLDLRTCVFVCLCVCGIRAVLFEF